jgi:hypothetical protein
MQQIRETKSGKKHQCNPVHYSHRNPKKSQWKPPEPTREFFLFECADSSGWTDGTADYWAVENENYQPNILGFDPKGMSTCRIARFRRDVDTAPWHGYPITLTRKGEKFPTCVLKQWEEEKILRRPWLTKMRKRQV